jgi:hypothetical protein
MEAAYIIDNEVLKMTPINPLTFAEFVARFFNYIFCADETN